MDAKRFDAMIRELYTDRRRLLRGVAAVVTGVLTSGLPRSVAGKPVKHGELRRRRQRHRLRAFLRTPPAVEPPNGSDCEDYMLALGCAWKLVQEDQHRWDCPRYIKAGGWDMFRCDGKDGITSLKGADLPGAYFREADMHGVTLDYASLRAVRIVVVDFPSELTGANLIDASFKYADVRSAEFNGANLSRVHFDYAVMRGAQLKTAVLTGASFVGADLTRADLTGAIGFDPTDATLCQTTLPDGQVTYLDC